jgi:Lon protease-like protein
LNAPGSAIDWANLALFPLGTVLFPGGVLPLRVFEKRYVDMTRECMKTGAPFGVCLIKDGKEVGTPAVPHEVGCLATISDWDMQQLGVLHLKTRGTQRFRILSTRAEPDGLLRAQAEPIADDAPTGVVPDYAACADVLRGVMDQLPAEAIPQPHRFEDASWLSNRLAEILPVPALAKQRLMELDDPATRLEVLYRFLAQQGLSPNKAR